MTDHPIRRFFKGPRMVLAHTPQDAVDLKALGYTEIAPQAPQRVHSETESAPEAPQQDAALVDEQPAEHTEHPNDAEDPDQ